MRYNVIGWDERRRDHLVVSHEAESGRQDEVPYTSSHTLGDNGK